MLRAWWPVFSMLAPRAPSCFPAPCAATSCGSLAACLRRSRCLSSARGLAAAASAEAAEVAQAEEARVRKATLHVPPQLDLSTLNLSSSSSSSSRLEERSTPPPAPAELKFEGQVRRVVFSAPSYACFSVRVDSQDWEQQVAPGMAAAAAALPSRSPARRALQQQLPQQGQGEGADDSSQQPPYPRPRALLSHARTRRRGSSNSGSNGQRSLLSQQQQAQEQQQQQSQQQLLQPLDPWYAAQAPSARFRFVPSPVQEVLLPPRPLPSEHDFSEAASAAVNADGEHSASTQQQQQLESAATPAPAPAQAPAQALLPPRRSVPEVCHDLVVVLRGALPRGLTALAGGPVPAEQCEQQQQQQPQSADIPGAPAAADLLGQSVRVRGRLVVHPRYGIQLEAADLRLPGAGEGSHDEVPAQGDGSASGLHGEGEAEAEDPLGLQPLDLLSLKCRIKEQQARLLGEATERTGLSLSISDITAVRWCGLQLAYQTASGKRKVQTRAMAAGSFIHEGLEADTTGEVMEVSVESAEDELAVVLLNAVTCIRQLLLEGQTRELRMMARVQGQWLVGVVDCLHRCPTTGLVSLTETKTRQSASRPPDAQVRSAQLQVLLYTEMWDAFRFVSLPDLHHYIFKVSSQWAGLNPQQPLCAELASLCASVGIRAAGRANGASSPAPEGPADWELGASAQQEEHAEQGQPRAPALALQDVVAALHGSLALLPGLGPTHAVEYISQATKAPIAREEVHTGADWFRSELRNSLDVWTGKRPPQPVARPDEWKCRRCDFRDSCRKWHPEHPLSNPAEFAAQTLVQIEGG